MLKYDYMASAVLTIPTNYYPGDREAAIGIAKRDLGDDHLIVRVSRDPQSPIKPMIEYYGSVAYGVDRFSSAIERGRWNEQLDRSYDSPRTSVA